MRHTCIENYITSPLVTTTPHFWMLCNYVGGCKGIDIYCKMWLSTQESGESAEKLQFHISYIPRQQPNLPGPCFPKGSNWAKPHHCFYHPSLRTDFHTSQKQDPTRPCCHPPIDGNATSSHLSHQQHWMWQYRQHCADVVGRFNWFNQKHFDIFNVDDVFCYIVNIIHFQVDLVIHVRSLKIPNLTVNRSFDDIVRT